MLYKYLQNILGFLCWPIKPKVFPIWPLKNMFTDRWTRGIKGGGGLIRARSRACMAEPGTMEKGDVPSEQKPRKTCNYCWRCGPTQEKKEAEKSPDCSFSCPSVSPRAFRWANLTSSQLLRKSGPWDTAEQESSRAWNWEQTSNDQHRVHVWTSVSSSTKWENWTEAFLREKWDC